MPIMKTVGLAAIFAGVGGALLSIAPVAAEVGVAGTAAAAVAAKIGLCATFAIVAAPAAATFAVGVGLLYWNHKRQERKDAVEAGLSSSASLVQRRQQLNYLHNL